MRELAWHLFTWGDQVEVVAPEVLRQTVIGQIELARRAHTTDSDVSGD